LSVCGSSGGGFGRFLDDSLPGAGLLLQQLSLQWLLPVSPQLSLPPTASSWSGQYGVERLNQKFDGDTEDLDLAEQVRATSVRRHHHRQLTGRLSRL
jgi:hypothetical protein